MEHGIKMCIFAALTLSCLIPILTTTAENDHTFQHKGLARSCVHNCECEWPLTENKTALWIKDCQDQCCLKADKKKLEELEESYKTCTLSNNDLKHVKEVNGQQAKQIRDHEISIGVLVPVLVLVIVTLVVYIIHLQMSLNKLTKTKKKVIQSQAASGDVSSVPHEIPGNETELKVLLPPEGENVRNEEDIHASGY